MAKIKLTLANFTDYLAKRYGDKIASYFEEEMDYKTFKGDRISYLDTLKLVNYTANGMVKKLGLKKGDRVISVLSNCQESFNFLFATAKFGGVIVPLNYMLKADEINYIVKNCGAKTIITEREVFEKNIKEKSNIPDIENWIMIGPEREVLPGFISIDQIHEGMDDKFEPAQLKGDDTVAIFYTSGTTGYPKGAMISSKGSLYLMNLFITKILLALVLWGRRNCGIMALPIAHIYGYAGSVGGLFAGVPGFLMKRFNAEKCLEAIEKYKATIFMGVPAMFSMMLSSNPEKYNLKSIKFWISAADALPVEYRKALEKISGKVIEGYGLVEGNALVAINLPFLRRAGSVGRRCFGVKVAVLDENGNKLPRGKVGELAVKAPTVMKGYWGNSQATKDTVKNGWLYTGDKAKMDRLGFIWFAGREKDMIKSGGYSLFPREIEEEILENEKIAEVAVFSMPHEQKGEIPVAVVSLKEGFEATAEEILAWCKERIAAFKCPRRIEIIPTEEMPHTMSYKIVKRQLKERMTKDNDK